MGILKHIEWMDNSANTMLFKVDIGKDYITKGSKLTVREGQVAVFCHKGQLADVFLPGFYTLDTDNVPVLTKLMSWKYGFESPFKSDIYFVNTKQFINEKWGTINPLLIRDADYGAIRVRGYGTYSFRVDDAYIFLKEMVGARNFFRTTEITGYLKSIIITGISDTIGESKIPILDMAGNLMELGKMVEEVLSTDFADLGLKLVKFNFENFSLPEELEKAIDQSASLGVLGSNMDTYMRKAQADAMINASKSNNTAGSTLNAGLGLGLGINMANSFGRGITDSSSSNQNTSSARCPSCNATVKEGARFCPECGKPLGLVCPKCKASVSPKAKFCPECGTAMSNNCKHCGASLVLGAKFCPECGGKQ